MGRGLGLGLFKQPGCLSFKVFLACVGVSRVSEISNNNNGESSSLGDEGNSSMDLRRGSSLGRVPRSLCFQLPVHPRRRGHDSLRSEHHSLPQQLRHRSHRPPRSNHDHAPARRPRFPRCGLALLPLLRSRGPAHNRFYSLLCCYCVAVPSRSVRHCVRVTTRAVERNG